MKQKTHRLKWIVIESDSFFEKKLNLSVSLDSDLKGPKKSNLIRFTPDLNRCFTVKSTYSESFFRSKLSRNSNDPLAIGATYFVENNI